MKKTNKVSAVVMIIGMFAALACEAGSVSISSTSSSSSSSISGSSSFSLISTVKGMNSTASSAIFVQAGDVVTIEIVGVSGSTGGLIKLDVTTPDTTKNTNRKRIVGKKMIQKVTKSGMFSVKASHPNTQAYRNRSTTIKISK